MATDVSTGLPQLTLQPGSRVVVSPGQGIGFVTKLVVKVFQVRPSEPQHPQPILVKRSGR